MKGIKFIFCTVFVAFITIVGIGTLNNHNETSSEENRNLTTFPEVDFSKFVDATYLNTITTAVSDQLEWRSQFVKLYYGLQKDILQQTYVGSIVIGKDDVLFNPPADIDDLEDYKAKVAKGSERINELNEVARECGTKIIVVDIPRKDISLQDYLPDYYPDNTTEYLELLEIQKSSLDEDISVIDVYSLFEENREKDNDTYFFHTDHHINPIGNDLILAEIMEVVHEDYPEVEQYRLDKYNILYKQMSGSFDKKIAGTTNADAEVLTAQSNGWEIAYTRYDNGQLSEKQIINVDSSGYSGTYMGGNIGETIVETNREELPSIFYFGYSFTNGLESLSVPSFDTMYSVDYRYNDTGKTAADYIREYQPEYVVLISANSGKTFKYANILVNLGLDKNFEEIEE